MWFERDLSALVGFELRRALVRPGARMALLLFSGILAVGHFEFWFGDGEPTLFVESACVALIGVLCFGIAEDRRRAFDRYMVRNHVEPRTYLLAKAIAMVALVLLGALYALVLKTAFSGGDYRIALWMSAFVALLGLMIAPAALLLEGYVDTSMPAAFVILGYPVLGGLVYLTTKSIAPFEWLGLTVIETNDWSSLGPMAVRTAIGIVPAFAIAGALLQLRLRRY
jgi:hypothetical protein